MKLSKYLLKIANSLKLAKDDFLHIQATRDKPFAYYLKWLLHSQAPFGISEDRPAGAQKRYQVDKVIRFLFRNEAQRGITTRKTYGPIEKPHPRFRLRKFKFWLYRIKVRGFKEFRLVILKGWYRPGFTYRAIYVGKEDREAAKEFFNKIK